jgi:hypothetical protein
MIRFIKVIYYPLYLYHVHNETGRKSFILVSIISLHNFINYFGTLINIRALYNG